MKHWVLLIFGMRHQEEIWRMWL